MGVNVIRNPFRKKPQAGYQSEGAYAMFAQLEDVTAPQLEIDPKSIWFHDMGLQYGDVRSSEGRAKFERMVAGTAVYDNVPIGGLEQPRRWALPWDEYAIQGHEAAKMVLENEGAWKLRGVRVEAGAMALFYRHYRYPTCVREVMLGQGCHELRLAVTTQGSVKIRVYKNREHEDSNLMTQEGTTCTAVLTLRRSMTRREGLIGQLLEKPHVALTMGVRETMGISATDMTTRTFTFEGKDYRMPMR